MELISIKNMHIYMHLLLLILAARTLAFSRYRRESNNTSLSANNSQNASNEALYVIEADWIIVPIIENATSQELSGSSSLSSEEGGPNGTAANDKEVVVVILEYNDEDYGSSSNSSDSVSNNGSNGSGETSSNTATSQNQPSNRAGT